MFFMNKKHKLLKQCIYEIEELNKIVKNKEFLKVLLQHQKKLREIIKQHNIVHQVKE